MWIDDFLRMQPERACKLANFQYVLSTSSVFGHYGALTLTPVGLSPTEHASLSLDAVRSKNPNALRLLLM
jgi:hypothetical protein